MSNTESTEESGTYVRDRQWSMENWVLIGVFFLLTAAGVVLSVRWAPAAVAVPAYVYLYASLGALGYAFTKLITGLGGFVEWGSFEELVEMGLRIPAAWVLGAGVFLLFGPIVPEGVPETGRIVAGVSFLVGLYVNVAVESLGALADRLLGT